MSTNKATGRLEAYILDFLKVYFSCCYVMKLLRRNRIAISFSARHTRGSKRNGANYISVFDIEISNR